LSEETASLSKVKEWARNYLPSENELRDTILSEERETLHILEDAQGPLKAKEIVDRFYSALSPRFSPADRAILKGGRQRWDETLRYVIYGFLKRGGYIQDTGKNQFVITEKGKQLLAKYYTTPSGKVDIQVR